MSDSDSTLKKLDDKLNHQISSGARALAILQLLKDMPSEIPPSTDIIEFIKFTAFYSTLHKRAVEIVKEFYEGIHETQ